MQNPGMGLADLLLSWRARRGLSRLAAARELGVAPPTLRAWEVAGVRPQPLQMARLAEALACDADGLRTVVGPDRVRTSRTWGGSSAAPLCRARLAAGLTTTQVARMLAVAPSTVSRWENGHRKPPPQLRGGLAGALRISPAELATLIVAEGCRRPDGVVLPGLGRVRRDRRLSQREFSRALGISVPAARAWETGRVPVPIDRLAAVAALLRLDADDLVGPASWQEVGREGRRPLREIRRAAGLTQRELAHHVGVSSRTMAHWEAGTRPLPVAAARRLATCLRRPLGVVMSAAGVELPRVPPAATWTTSGLPAVLSALRRSAGLSVAALGRSTGSSASSVRSWETGVVTPPASTAQRLELVLGLPRGSLTRLVSVSAAPPAAARRAGLTATG